MATSSAGSRAAGAPALAVTGVVYAVGVVVFAVLLLVLRPEAVTRADVAVGRSVRASPGTVGIIVAVRGARHRPHEHRRADHRRAQRRGPGAVRPGARRRSSSRSTLVGLVLALVAVIIVSTTTGTVEEHGMPPLAVALSVLAGASFACSLVSLSLTAARRAGSRRCSSRASSARVVMGVALVARRRDDVARRCRRCAWRPRPALLDAAANVTMISAIRIGPLAVASVVGGALSGRDDAAGAGRARRAAQAASGVRRRAGAGGGRADRATLAAERSVPKRREAGGEL